MIQTAVCKVLITAGLNEEAMEWMGDLDPKNIHNMPHCLAEVPSAAAQQVAQSWASKGVRVVQDIRSASCSGNRSASVGKTNVMLMINGQVSTSPRKATVGYQQAENANASSWTPTTGGPKYPGQSCLRRIRDC